MNREIDAKMMRRLVGLFRWERRIYLALAGVIAVMLLIVLTLLLAQQAGTASFVLVLGSVGLLMIILGRVRRMWERVDELILRVSREQASRNESHQVLADRA